jgi:hypothetical protein
VTSASAKRLVKRVDRGGLRRVVIFVLDCDGATKALLLGYCPVLVVVRQVLKKGRTIAREEGLKTALVPLANPHRRADLP